MIKNEVVLEANWDKLIVLISKLDYLKDLHRYSIEIQEQENEKGGLMYGRRVLQYEKSESLDRVFAKAANEFIMEYIKEEA